METLLPDQSTARNKIVRPEIANPSRDTPTAPFYVRQAVETCCGAVAGYLELSLLLPRPATEGRQVMIAKSFVI